MTLAEALEASGLPDTARLRDAGGTETYSVAGLRRQAATRFPFARPAPFHATPDEIAEYGVGRVAGLVAIRARARNGRDLGVVLIEVGGLSDGGL